MACPKVNITIVNWNGWQDTLECLRSVMTGDYPNLDVLVVDNHSSDQSITELRAIGARGAGIRLLESPVNLGYAGANNLGLRHALQHDAAYCLLLNNDTIAEKTLVTSLATYLEEHPRTGMVGPKILEYGDPSTVWFAGATIDWKTGKSPHVGIGEPDCGGFAGVVDAERLTGCAMLVRREVVETIGLLDEEYFLYYEDVDWSVRCRRAGYHLACVRDAVLWHKVSRVTKASSASPLHGYYESRNRLLFLKKQGALTRGVHREALQKARRILKRLAGAYVGLTVCEASERAYLRSQLQGILDFYRGRVGKHPRYPEGN